MFSTRLAFADAPNALSKAKAKRLSANLPLLDMSDANPATAGFGWSVAELGSFMRKEGLQRQEPDPRGLAATRAAIADYYSARGVRVSADRLFLSASTSEGIAGSSSCSAIPATRCSSLNPRIHCSKSSPLWKASRCARIS